MILKKINNITILIKAYFGINVNEITSLHLIMVSSITTTGARGQDVVALFYLDDTTSHLINSVTPDTVKLVQITGLINTKGNIDVQVWCHYSDRMRKMLTTLSHKGKVKFILQDNDFIGVINPNEGKVHRMFVTLYFFLNKKLIF